MPSWLTGPMIRLVWVALLAAALQLVSSREADASCGDYLLHRGMTTQDNSAFAPYAPQFPFTQPVPEPDPHQPCHGPGCRQAPPPLPATPSAPVEFLPQQFAVTQSRESACVDRLQSWIGTLATIKTHDGYPLGLLRPPAV